MRTSAFLTLVVFLAFFSETRSQELNTDKSTLFSGSGNCSMCHASSGGANTSKAGADVSPPTDWRSSMMANAARDPYWQATVIAESIDHPELVAVIQDKCTNCHTPMGHEQSHADGASAYALGDAVQSGLAMDAVSCTLCHQVVPDNFGAPESFSGGYLISSTRVTFGPYENPLLQPMKNMTGFEPRHSAHIEEAELCGTCHVLFTPFLDKQGQIVGEFPEQTTFLEWKASAFADEGVTCQKCHMPALDEAMRISILPQTAGLRQPIFQHHFVGGNTFMLGLLKSRTKEVGTTALESHFATSIERTKEQLQQRSVELTSSGAFVESGELRVSVHVRNLAGHKFPSGFPSRRAWLHVTVQDADQQKVFESGQWNVESEITALDEHFEAHYDVITSADEVQIWESVMGDTEGEVTARLMHGAQYLKDNRIPPRGFDAGSMSSDTVGTVGTDGDANFNPYDGEKFTGSDDVTYAITLDPGWRAPFTVAVDLCYQSIKPAFIENLDDHDAPEISKMHMYYETTPQKVEVLQSLVLQSQDINAIGSDPGVPSVASLSLYPQPLPASSGMLHLRYELAQSVRGGEISIVSLLGQEVLRIPMRVTARGMQTQHINAGRLLPGVYFLLLDTGDGRRGTSFQVAPW